MALAQAYGLREAVVIMAGGRGDLKAELGGAAAAYFEKIARNGMRIGRRDYTLEQLRLEIERPIEMIQASSMVDVWAMRGGNPSIGPAKRSAGVIFTRAQDHRIFSHEKHRLC